MKSNQLPVNEYADFYKSYIQVLENVELQEELEISLHKFIKFVQNIPMDKFDYRYADGKWTIKEIIQHLIDCERVLSYRALRISRNDKTPLPGFDENNYAANGDASHRNWKDLLIEWRTVRQATNLLFASFTPEQMKTKGNCNGHDVTVNALGFILFGHALHHLHILKERYDI